MVEKLLQDLKKFRELSAVQKQFFCFACLLLVLILPLIIILNNSLQNYFSGLEELNDLKFKLNKYTANRELQDNPATSENGVTADFAGLKKMAEANGLTLVKAEFKDEPEVKEINSQWQGSYLGFLGFIEKYTSAGYPYELGLINIREDKANVSIELKLTWQTEQAGKNDKVTDENS